MDFKMDDRKIKILQAIIHDYIITGEPVGSRTIAKKYELGVSSATIRNEMSDLEEMGFIEQLHTSSGRKPSDKGYRLYVDKFIRLSRLTPEEELKIKEELINEALYEVNDMVRKALTLLSELTKLTCIVKTPSVKHSSIKLIQLLNIDNNILAIIITQNGIINNNIIRLNRSIDSYTLQKITNLLNSKLNNLTIKDIDINIINDIKNCLRGQEDIFDAIIVTLYDALTKADNSEVYCEGAANIFNYSEYKDIERARQFLSLIDNKKLLKQLFSSKDISNESGKRISIKIGKENFIKDAQNCSIVAAVYSLGNQPLGTIGVIGPTRMQYSKVISLLIQFVNILNKNIQTIYFDDR